MKSSLPYFLDFPKDFGRELEEAINRATNRGVNLQMVGLKGSGKSLMFRAILSRNKEIKYIDCNLLTDRYIEELGKKGLSGICLIDSFENIVGFDNGVVKKIMSIYDQNRDYVTFVFSVEREMVMKSSCDTYYVKSLSKLEGKWFVEGLRQFNNNNIGAETINKIIEVSGGYMTIIKRLYEAVVGGENLEKLIYNPQLNTHLKYQLELMVEGLGKDKNNIEVLKKYYLVNEKGKFLSKVVENFMSQKSGFRNKNLTREEDKAMKLLENNTNKICLREDLIEAIWGRSADLSISDHALDQLMHRLRNKLKSNGVEIETVRGRGYILNNF